MNHAPTTPDWIGSRLARGLRNPYTLHRALGVVLWMAFAAVLTWRGGA